MGHHVHGRAAYWRVSQALHHIDRMPTAQSCVVFIGRSGQRAVVVTEHYNGQGGFRFEDDTPVVISDLADSASLGAAILAALALTRIMPERSFRGRSATEWPAYRSSGAGSIRAFEAEFIRVHITGANDANISFQIEGYPEKDAALRVVGGVSLGAPAAMGEACLAVWRACRDRVV